MRTTLLCLTLFLATIACRRPTTFHLSGSVAAATLAPGTFITAPGSYHHDDGTVEREITVSVDSDLVRWNIRRSDRRVETGSSLKLSTAGDPWFIYVEAPGRLWNFNGSDHLSGMEEVRGSWHSRPGIIDGKIHPDCPSIPAEIFPRLPVGLQALAPPQVERPSF